MSTNIQTSITIGVYPDDDYHFSVTVDDESNTLSYIEQGVAEQQISFASAEEMVAVAEAMLKAAKFFRS